MTLKDLIQEQEERKQARKRAADEITELEKDVEYLESEARKMAAEGKENGYMQLMRSVSDKRNMIEAKQIRLEATTDTLDEAEVLKVWNGFRKEHDKKFDAAMKVLDKARAEFLRAYEEVCDIQNEGLYARYQAATLIGCQGEPHKAAKKFGMKTFPVWNGDLRAPSLSYLRCTCVPDTAFFMAASDMDASLVHSVMVQNRAVVVE